MRKTTIVFSIISAILTVCGGPWPSRAQAGPLLDWLFHRRPATTAYYPLATTTASPCTQVCQRVLVSYQPYTTYRTTWAQVPVTYFRPVAATDPCTGCPVTSMQPCTTYRWQVRRVPVCTYRPVYQTVAAPTTVAQPVVSQPACPCAGSQPATGAAGIPSIQVPGTGIPAIQAPAAGQPYGNGLAPAPQGGSVPANIPPSLGTQSVLSPSNGTIQGYYPGYPYSSAYPPQPPPAAPSNGQTSPGSSGQGQDQTNGGGNHNGSSNGTSNGSQEAAFPRSFNTPATLQEIRPIPDPDTPQLRWPTSDMPQLLNPRDKTAQRPVRATWAVAKINWNEPSSVPAAPKVDDGGWRTSRGKR